MATLEFDATNVDPSTTFPLYPAGKYVVEIIQSEMRATKDGNGQFLWLEMGILDGEHAGGKIFDRLNLVNANVTAQEIAQRALSAICHAVGVMQVTDSEQLHFKPMTAEVRVKPAVKDEAGNEKYAAQNEVRGYSAAPGNTTAQPATAATRPLAAAVRPVAAAAVKTAVATATAPPWRRPAA